MNKKCCLVYIRSPYGWEYVRYFESIKDFNETFPSSTKEGYIQLSKPIEMELEFEELSQEEITIASVNAIDNLIEKEKEKATKVIDNLLNKKQELLSITFEEVKDVFN